MGTRILLLIAALALALIATSLTAADILPNRIPDSARIALEKAERFELLSLDPGRYRNRRPTEEFHGFRILGSMLVTNAEIRNDLVTALKKSVEESKGLSAYCFNPRHGISVTHDGKTNDFVICFECLQVITLENDKKIGDFLITETPEPLFNRVLMKRNIPLAGR